jgi:hypothetical protein
MLAYGKSGGGGGGGGGGPKEEEAGAPHADLGVVPWHPAGGSPWVGGAS